MKPHKPATNSLLFVTNISLGVLVVGMILISRLTGLTDSPPGFYKDEAAMTVNGYSILQTGKDEYGIPWPVFFRSFDDWKAPIFIYSQLPFLQILGMDILATRLTAAVWGLMTIAIFAILVWLMYRRYWVVLIGTLTLAMLPWHFHFSRIGFELITVPFFATLSLLCVYQWLRTHKRHWYLLNAVTTGLSVYTYPSARVMGPLLFVGLSLWCYRQLKAKEMVLAIIIISLCLLPLLLWSDRYPDFLTQRYQSVTIIEDTTPWLEVIRRYLFGYGLHFTPGYWFLKGDHNLRHSVQYHYPLLWTMAVPFGVGLWRLFRDRRTERWNQWLLIHLATFQLVSALTRDPPMFTGSYTLFRW